MSNNIQFSGVSKQLEGNIYLVFREYGCSRGEKNKKAMQRVFEYCLKDIEEHPDLPQTLDSTQDGWKHFIIQSMIYIVREPYEDETEWV